LILIWALPPIMLQTAFGGDILWRNRRLVTSTIVSATAYLGCVDSLAIGDGTWKINQKNTVKYEVIPNLPFEELLFFFLTIVLLVFGVTLVQSKESERRLPEVLKSRYFAVKSRLKEANES
jgi:15-cis-phytoene synthase/lycopene beta-cyclase